LKEGGSRSLTLENTLGDSVRQGCIACRILGYDTEDVPTEIHHLRSGTPESPTGLGLRSDRYICLCPYHHRLGPDSYHRSKVEFERNHGTEEELWQQSQEGT